MYLNEATLLNNIRIRYMKNQIYVSKVLPFLYFFSVLFLFVFVSIVGFVLRNTVISIPYTCWGFALLFCMQMCSLTCMLLMHAKVPIFMGLWSTDSKKAM